MEVQRLQKERADLEADLNGKIAVLKEEVKELTSQREKAFKDTAAAVREAASTKDEIRKGTEGVGQLQAQLAAAQAQQRDAEERAQQVAATNVTLTRECHRLRQQLGAPAGPASAGPAAVAPGWAPYPAYPPHKPADPASYLLSAPPGQ